MRDVRVVRNIIKFSQLSSLPAESQRQEIKSLSATRDARFLDKFLYDNNCIVCLLHLFLVF